MAITKTTSVERVEVYPAQDSYAAATTNAGNATLMVVYQITFDDSADDLLPTSTPLVKRLNRYTITTNDEGESTSAATDVTGEDQVVQDICGAIWS